MFARSHLFEPMPFLPWWQFILILPLWTNAIFTVMTVYTYFTFWKVCTIWCFVQHPMDSISHSIQIEAYWANNKKVTLHLYKKQPKHPGEALPIVSSTGMCRGNAPVLSHFTLSLPMQKASIILLSKCLQNLSIAFWQWRFMTIVLKFSISNAKDWDSHKV